MHRHDRPYNGMTICGWIVPLIAAGMGLVISCGVDLSNSSGKACPCEPPENGAKGDTSIWGNAQVGSDTTVLFFPDGKAVYWGYAFERPAGDSIGYHIYGDFPSARYMSFNLYDDDTRDVIGNLRDEAVSPDCCSDNPFEAAGEGYEDRNYTLSLMPSQPVEGDDENVLVFSPDVTELALIYRMYLPDGDQQGGAELPRIETVNSHTGEVVANSPNVALLTVAPFIIEMRVNPIFDDNPADSIHFFSYPTGGFYPNADVQYLVAGIERDSSEVLMFRFIAPAEDQMRYWSVSLGSQASRNYYTLADEDVAVASDGYVYVVVGDSDADIEAKAERFNFIPWMGNNRIVLIYRNLAVDSGYVHALSNVPVFDRTQAVEPQRADNFIGDYAPTGRLMSRTDFLDGLGGFPVP